MRTDFVAMRESFTAGETLVYVESAYSRYDGVSGFMFSDSIRKTRTWNVSDDEPLESWSQLFERLNE
jgi:hypothetical protein